jgi:hypothetical protein
MALKSDMMSDNARELVNTTNFGGQSRSSQRPNPLSNATLTFHRGNNLSRVRFPRMGPRCSDYFGQTYPRDLPPDWLGVVPSLDLVALDTPRTAFFLFTHIHKLSHAVDQPSHSLSFFLLLLTSPSCCLCSLCRRSFSRSSALSHASSSIPTGTSMLLAVAKMSISVNQALGVVSDTRHAES